MVTIHHQLAIAAPVSKVYAAIASAEQIGSWWDRQKPLQTPKGLILEHDPGPEHGTVKLRVVQLLPNRRVEWECVSQHPKTSPASAWTGTRFVFDLSGGDSPAARFGGDDADPLTTLDFRQEGYDEASEFAGFNNFAWAQVLQNLKQTVEAKPG
ncbi:MAG: SRPBCC family protein [Steroidobacteraceae bacterium]